MPDASLFGPDVPDGFVYRDDFITPEDEDTLLSRLAAMPFSTFEMRGVVARRRVAFFGRSYTAGQEETPIPDMLLSLRAQVAAWAAVEPASFAMALVNEYRPGAPIGWHRDAPQYDLVAGVSLLAPCRMRFRPYGSRPSAGARTQRTTTHEVVLEPRSVYLISGAARQDYEHHIPAVTTLRYSITFRTLRRPGRE